MATNLRLRPETEAALRERAQETGTSQQEIIRLALDRFLGLGAAPEPGMSRVDDLIARGLLHPGTPYREIDVPLTLPAGVSTRDLMDREDRF
jgi:hypothetical protein